MTTWNQIVRDNAKNVLAAAYRVLGNLSDAEDVSQDVFAEAFKKWDGNIDQSWSGLLKRLSICRSIDLLRRKKEVVPFVDHCHTGNESNPLESAIAKEQQQRLRLAIAEFPPRESEVFCMVYFEQMSNVEVANQLGISKSAVAKSLSKARGRLEKVFYNRKKGEIA